MIATNLTQNAIAVSAAGGLVTVDLTHTPDAVTLTVADAGPGIDPALRPHLFEPGHSSRPGGSGLGLAISRLLARQIGAELTLVRTGAEGTVFRATLRLA